MDSIKIDYQNWKGERRIREILPIRLLWGSNEYHPTEQWLLEATDLEKQATRFFALKGIKAFL